ncbi:MAG: hypothetical protein ACOX42_09735 [Clostridia bacterium]
MALRLITASHAARKAGAAQAGLRAGLKLAHYTPSLGASTAWRKGSDGPAQGRREGGND